MSDIINEIASKHLGKAGDGTVVKPYVTPDSVDKSLLVGVPRVLNRTQYDIKEDDLPFVGTDAWNAYEFSTLLDNGFPVSGVLKLTYPADSVNIVESKSIKLYLNSFNMMKNGKTVEQVRKNVIDQVRKDLTECVQCDGRELWVNLFLDEDTKIVAPPILREYNYLETSVDVESMEFPFYNENPDILKIVDSDGKPQRWRSNSLRSNCRVTNQPDWGDVYVYIKGGKTVTPESLLQYIVSMRKENHFHEEVCECMYKRLYDLAKPDELMVTCLYTRRGGIDINPVRATSVDLAKREARTLLNAFAFCEKTARQ